MVDVTVRPTREEISRAFGNDFRLTKAFEGLFNNSNDDGGGFLSSPDLNDDTELDYFYFGWRDVDDSWLIRRQRRSDSSNQNAIFNNNQAYSDLDSAWPQRLGLVYV